MNTDRLPKRLDRIVGKVAAHAHLSYGRFISLEIIGDKKGLLYIAEVLRHAAMFDMKTIEIPDGALAHIHLTPGGQLLNCSLELVISRAEAKGTGEMPDEFDAQ